jgi:hypothetical protein
LSADDEVVAAGFEELEESDLESFEVEDSLAEDPEAASPFFPANLLSWLLPLA